LTHQQQQQQQQRSERVLANELTDTHKIASDKLQNQKQLLTETKNRKIIGWFSVFGAVQIIPCVKDCGLCNQKY